MVQPGISWTDFLGPALVAISVTVAWLALRNARAVARQKATLDLIEKIESDQHYRQITDRFSELRRGIGFSHLNDPAPENRDDRRAVLDYLNHYEIVAIGIRHNILDAEMYRAWMEGVFVRDWNAAAEFIQRERWKGDATSWTYRASVFEHFQWAATRWSKDATRLSAKTSPPPSRAAGPGDEPLPESEA
ncbi:MAG: DUF4760 domain-containing protein [Pseudomonadota bacterium]